MKTIQKQNKKKLASLFAVMHLASFGMIGDAVATSSTLDIGADVIASCIIGTPSPINFGNYAFDLLQTTTTVSIKCTPGTIASIGASKGGGGVNAKAMTSGEFFLKYELYTDNYGGTIFNESPTGKITHVGDGTEHIKTIYAEVPANQTTADAGTTLSDSVSLTVTIE